MKYLIKNKYWRLTEYYNIDKLLYLLIDRPNKTYKIDSAVNFRWQNDMRQSHRNYDFPAVITHISIEWFNDGKIDRNIKPALIYNSGNVQYWTKGRIKKSGIIK